MTNVSFVQVPNRDGGELIMHLQETPWSPAYGQVKDKFGITWQISTVVE